ncbi:EF-hand domain-containing protein [Chelativorans sp.]|uniref:EF-hand domain-containing protein n=1 Tax=Chelativorans sp. TaxID=2203393 RepID=UPI0028110C6C|nr:EF-hand domain-containing protein [Chelativorans sp.]
MLRTVLVSAIALSVAAGAAALAQDAQPTQPPAASGNQSPAASGNQAPTATEGAQRRTGGVFGRLDADGNGTIAREELGGDRLEMLRAADENNDGTLTEQELVTYLTNREFQRRAERTARRLDIDGNGTVTIAEIEDHHNKRFALLDRNNDGQLSQDELRRGGMGKRVMHMRRGDGPRFAMGRGDGPRHEFRHRRMESAAPGTPSDDTPAQE